MEESWGGELVLEHRNSIADANLCMNQNKLSIILTVVIHGCTKRDELGHQYEPSQNISFPYSLLRDVSVYTSYMRRRAHQFFSDKIQDSIELCEIQVERK
jgi:hypothetical protein